METNLYKRAKALVDKLRSGSLDYKEELNALSLILAQPNMFIPVKRKSMECSCKCCGEKMVILVRDE